MASLGITPRAVIRATYADYLATLPTTADAERFVDEMTADAGTALQDKIDEADTWLTAADEAARQASGAVASLTIQGVCQDPMSPIASAGVVASASSTIAVAHSTLSTATAALQQVRRAVRGFNLPVPAVVDTVAAAIGAASDALDAIKIL